ncbi:MAG: exopolysaccharide biosynthesis polyprenyl glycosylphosphotransferase [Vicingus serpentipes]|nr:exopolysaccharide biosynthesis polyprenyl glycosylphosphotransferase [Vicingus serpentipes]
MTRYSQYIRLINVLGDFILLNTSYTAAFYIKFGEIEPSYFLMLLYINIIWWLISTVTKPYKLSRTSKLHQVIGASYLVLFFHVLLVFAYYVFEQSNQYSRELLVIMYSFLFVSIFVWKIVFILLLRRFRKKGYNYRNIIIITDANNSIQIQPYIENHPEDGYRIKRVFNPISYHTSELLHEDVKDFCLNNHVHEIFYSISSMHHASLVDLMNFTEENFIKMRLIADFKSVMFRTFRLEHFDLIPILNVVSTPLDDWRNQFLKQVFDIIFSLFVIVFVLSWLIPILAILIKIDSKGPIFFIQKRTGRDNKPFFCYKLRSMYVNGQSDEKQSTLNDERITPLGHFLRNTSLDELPQFFNVILGNMSVVGPRPHMLKHTEDFTKELETFMVRHKIKPGITGLAQTKGYRGETQDFEQKKNRIKMDVFYIKNWSFIFDLAIIVNTVLDIFRNTKN